MASSLSENEAKAASVQQAFSLERKIRKGEFTIEEIGDCLPGNILLTDLNKLSTAYMNKRGCDFLMHNVEELEALGPDYYQTFFVPDETAIIVSRFIRMHEKQEASDIFNFCHRVKPVGESHFEWFFATTKLLYTPGEAIASKMLLIVNSVNSVGGVAQKMNRLLEETLFVKKNFQAFCRLTKREKEIITWLVRGKSSPEISDILSVSRYTINSHRRNIIEKLQAKSFSDVYRFAVAFDLD